MRKAGLTKSNESVHPSLSSCRMKPQTPREALDSPSFPQTRSLLPRPGTSQPFHHIHPEVFQPLDLTSRFLLPFPVTGLSPKGTHLVPRVAKPACPRPCPDQPRPGAAEPEDTQGSQTSCPTGSPELVAIREWLRDCSAPKSKRRARAGAPGAAGSRPQAPPRHQGDFGGFSPPCPAPSRHLKNNPCERTRRG